MFRKIRRFKQQLSPEECMAILKLELMLSIAFVVYMTFRTAGP